MFYAELPCMGYISCCCLVFCILLKPFIIKLGIKNSKHNRGNNHKRHIKHVWEVKYIYVQYKYSQFIYVLNCQWKWVGFLLCNYIIFFFIKSCIWISYEKQQQFRICNAIFKWTLDPKKWVPWSQTGILICYHNCISLFILFA